VDNSAVARQLIDLYGFCVRELFITDNFIYSQSYAQQIHSDINTFGVSLSQVAVLGKVNV
jgi:hypothetical protein